MFFNRKTKEYSNNEIIAPVTGKIIPNEQLNDCMFKEEMMGQTLAIRPNPDYLTVCAPANGKLEVLFPTGHAFAIRMDNGMGLLVHIGVDTVKLKGKGFKVLAKKDEMVKAGQGIVKVDFDFLKEKGLDYEVMMVITDFNQRVEYNCSDYVKSKDLIAKI